MVYVMARQWIKGRARADVIRVRSNTTYNLELGKLSRCRVVIVGGRETDNHAEDLSKLVRQYYRRELGAVDPFPEVFHFIGVLQMLWSSAADRKLAPHYEVVREGQQFTLGRKGWMLINVLVDTRDEAYACKNPLIEGAIQYLLQTPGAKVTPDDFVQVLHPKVEKVARLLAR